MKAIELVNVKGRDLRSGDMILIKNSVVKVKSNQYFGVKVIFYQLYGGADNANCTREITICCIADKIFKKIENPYTDQLFVINNDIKYNKVSL
jgi:hypothetical protein